MENREIKNLLIRYQTGKCTEQEKAILESWYLSTNPEVIQELSAEDFATDLMLIKKGVGLEPKVGVTRLWPQMIAAAVALIILGAALFYYNQGKDQGAVHKYANDINPGKQGATLTLANGTKIRLSDAANGQLASQAGVTVSKTKNGQLVYEVKASDKTQSDLGAINTLSTARGETYQVNLPDGSKVWLNAASSLTYTANLLNQGKRSVKLAGEGYFEIAKDKAHPFIVESQGQQIEVLGTHFNVNAYSDEPVIKTTLLEGNVNVQANGKLTNLEPGFQASNDGKAIKVAKADTELAVAWKNELFLFDEQDLPTIMRMISRWYNVEVIYEGKPSTDTFSGGINRFDKISKVLESLSTTKTVQFKVEGRKVYVYQ